jgi:hypothetical protein
MNLWTSVKDSLPKEGEEVLIVWKDKLRIAILAWERPDFEDTWDAFQYWEVDTYDEIDWRDVTYWMELPLPPKEGKVPR